MRRILVPAALLLFALPFALALVPPLGGQRGLKRDRSEQPSASPDASWLRAVRELPSPAGPLSGEPQLQSDRRGVLLSWLEHGSESATLQFAPFVEGGWGKARTAASGTNWFVNWADVPSVVRLSDQSLAAHWLQKSGPETYAYDVRLTYSKDGGRTWAPSFTPHHDGTQTEHGFASLFSMPEGGLGLVWLDGRQTKSHGAQHGSPAGAMTVRFGAFDQNWRQVADVPLDDRVCDCCPTTAALTTDGPIVAFRNRTEDEIRDIYVSRLEGQRWSEPVPVHRDGWRVAACPVNGPMLSARGQKVALSWFTAVGDVGRAYVAFSGDGGRSFGSPVRLDEVSTLGRVDVELLADGSAVSTWIELGEPKASFMVRKISPSGIRTPAIRIATLEGSRTSGYPRVALHGDQLFFAWTDTKNGEKAVRTATATLTR